MKISKIWIHNFRSFTEPQSILIKRMPPGLYHVAGQNDVEPSLGANGAGKSSLFEALFWAFYGKTSRNVKAGNVINWGAQTAEVRVFSDTGEVWRKQSPNELRIRHQTHDDLVDQVRLEQFLGIDSDEFLYSYYFSQFSPSFIDLSPAARMDVYSRVMKLDKWEEKSEQARFLRGEYEKEVTQLEQKVARSESAIEILEQNEAEIKARIEEWTEEHINELSESEKKIEKATKKLRALQKGVNEEREELKYLVRESKEANSVLGTSLELLEKMKRNHHDAEIKLARSTEALESATAALNRFKDVAEKPACATCGQEIDKRHAIKHRKQLEAAQAAAKQKQRVWAGHHNEAYDDMKDHQGAVNEAKDRADKFDLAMRRLKETVDKNEIYILQAENEEDNAKFELKKLVAKKNPYSTERSVLEARVRKARGDLHVLNKELQGVRFMANSFEFWQKGFKDIRFQLIEESLAQLNAEVNECCVALGLNDWRLEFSVERETKKGTVRRGFNCDVYCNDMSLPWEVWSGGESQRLRLAAQLGVANLISARTGFECNLEMWDEPTTWLGEEGIKDLLAVLEDRAKRYGRVILIADHRSIDYPFAGTVLVTKGAAGSVISW